MSDTINVKVDDSELAIRLKDPSLKDRQESEKVYNEAFSRAVKSGALLRAKLEDFVREQGLWDDESEAKLTDIQKKISNGELRLARGGFRLSEARELALDMRRWRQELRSLLADRMTYDNNTAEGQADNARFNYFVYSCTINAEHDKMYYSSFEDFMNRSAGPVAMAASQALASKMYGLESNYENKLPENDFLKEFSFIDKELRLIDEQGRFIDMSGHLINEEGRLIDEEGRFVDINGNLVDEDSKIIAERKPFLTDSDKPIENELEEENDEEEKIEEPALANADNNG